MPNVERKMVVVIEEYTFEKHPKKDAGIVNIYHEGIEIDCFTHYNIGTDFDLFEQSCLEYYNENLEGNYYGFK
jgi:hypothetical protein